MNIQSTKKLNNGIEMPVIGLGVYGMSELEAVESVQWAIEAGYRLIDTAKLYGNEAGVGEGVRRSGVPREEIFITTKLWALDMGFKNTLKAFDASLKRLGMDYVDLYLIHWPVPVKSLRKGSWEAMLEIYRSGRAKAIGVSNYSIKLLEEVRSYTDRMPAVNQVQFHPFEYKKDLLEYCHKNGIVLEAYSPLTRGYKLNDKQITRVAQKYNKTNAQILLRWGLQHNAVVIPKSSHQERIKENINIFDFELAEDDMKALDLLAY